MRQAISKRYLPISSIPILSTVFIPISSAPFLRVIPISSTFLYNDQGLIQNCSDTIYMIYIDH